MRKLWAAVVKLRTNENTLTVEFQIPLGGVQRQCCKSKCLNTTQAKPRGATVPSSQTKYHQKKGEKVGMLRRGPYPRVWFLYDSRGRLHAPLQQTRTAGRAEMLQGHGQWGNSAEETCSDSSQPPLTQAAPLEKSSASHHSSCEEKLHGIYL